MSRDGFDGVKEAAFEGSWSGATRPRMIKSPCIRVFLRKRETVSPFGRTLDLSLLVWICYEFQLFALGIAKRADLTRRQDVLCKLARIVFAQAPAHKATIPEHEDFAVLAPTWDPPCVVEFLGIRGEART